MEYQHQEIHFTGSEVVRDIVIGMSDGLIVPFALAAGLTGAVDATAIVVTAGMAEIAAGSISMGLGGYLAAKSSAEHFYSEQKREEREVRDIPEVEEAEVTDILSAYGVTVEEARPLVEALKREPKRWIDFMMRFELGLEEPDPKRALMSAMTIAASYIVGGLVPLAPYMFTSTTFAGLIVSSCITAVALMIFGYLKGSLLGVPPVRDAFRTLLIGGIAATVAFLLARLLS